MGRRVAIVGTGQTKHVSKRRDVNIPEMIYEAVKACLEDAELTINDIDAILIGNMEHFEGINSVEMQAIDFIGGYLKHVMRITTGGTTGTTVSQAGFYHVSSCLFDVVMTIGWEKQSDGDTTAGLIFQSDPLYERPTMAGAIGSFALGASMYMAKYGITEEQAAKVAVKARSNAMKNPYAHLRLSITVEDVMKSRILAWPIKLLDMCPTSDGACALIFACEEKARKITKTPVWIKAVASRHDQPFNADLPMLDRMRTLTEAAKAVYSQAGIINPRKEIDVAEIYEPCTFAELAWYEAVGFCDWGEGGKLMDSGATQLDGDIPVNPSGGVLSTNCIGATGMIRVAEAAIQIMGKGGERQVPDVKTALVTGFGGSWWSDALILSKD